MTWQAKARSEAWVCKSSEVRAWAERNVVDGGARLWSTMPVEEAEAAESPAEYYEEAEAEAAEEYEEVPEEWGMHHAWPESCATEAFIQGLQYGRLAIGVYSKRPLRLWSRFGR